MTKRSELYKCELCGNIAEMMHAGQGTMVCCGQTMTKIVENTTDAAKEKHVPVLTKTEDGWKVAVGSVEHPMTDAHYIEWIELITEDKTYIKYLKPNDKPEAEFCTCAKKVTARAYCNLHGNWKIEG